MIYSIFSLLNCGTGNLINEKFWGCHIRILVISQLTKYISNFSEIISHLMSNNHSFSIFSPRGNFFLFLVHYLLPFPVFKISNPPPHFPVIGWKSNYSICFQFQRSNICPGLICFSSGRNFCLKPKSVLYFPSFVNQENVYNTNYIQFLKYIITTSHFISILILLLWLFLFLGRLPLSYHATAYSPSTTSLSPNYIQISLLEF